LNWVENLKEGDHLVFRGVDGRIILKANLKKVRRSWTGIIGLRIETSDGFLRIWYEVMNMVRGNEYGTR